MLPVPLLLALLIAFGFDPPSQVPPLSLRVMAGEVTAVISLVALLAYALGAMVGYGVTRQGHATVRLRRAARVGSRLLSIVGLLAFAWIIHGAGWSRYVLDDLRTRNLILIDDILVFLPYLPIQLLTWWGACRASAALHDEEFHGKLRPIGRQLWARTRQALGLSLPVILILVVRQDVTGRLWPGLQEGLFGEVVEMACLGGGVLLVAPVFARIAWPTHPLPAGPLRTRLEGIASQAGFRFTDLLVWETDHQMLNACVTGMLPWFRYVMMTDAFLDTLSPAEVAAVFGHEVGHTAHRHLPFYGFFMLGTLALLPATAPLVTGLGDKIVLRSWVPEGWESWTEGWVEGALMLALIGLFFRIVFGHLSRRFERQADIYGCRIVSCGHEDCPPHFDIERGIVGSGADPDRRLCPGGIRIFIDALATIAREHGIDFRARSWRHGSIASRIAFLEGLIADPLRERRFQREVKGLRWAIVVMFGFVVGVALLTGWAGLAS